MTYELDLLLEVLDREKPEVIINYAAQGEGAVSWKHSWRFFETKLHGIGAVSGRANGTVLAGEILFKLELPKCMGR